MQPKIKNKVFNVCRSCGNVKMYTLHTPLQRRWKGYWIECGRCGSCAPNAHTMSGAIKKWNKVNPQVAKAIEAGNSPRGTKGEDA